MFLRGTWPSCPLSTGEAVTFLEEDSVHTKQSPRNPHQSSRPHCKCSWAFPLEHYCLNHPLPLKCSVKLSAVLRALPGEPKALSVNSWECPKEFVGTFLHCPLGTLPMTSSTLLLNTWTRASSRILIHGLVTDITDFLSQCSFTIGSNVPRPRPDLQFIHCWVFHSTNLITKTWHLSHKLFLKKRGGVGIFTSVSTVLHGTFGQLLSLKLPNFPSLFASQL